MSNSFFRFKQFIIRQDKCAMKVTTDACLFGAWLAEKVRSQESGVGSQNLKVGNVLDIGTGTGLLSLMLAQNCDANIDAIEIDDQAAAQATENEEACSFRNSIQVINADIRDHHFEKKYDVIISNPPFYENELKSVSSKKNIAHHGENLSLQDLLTAIKQNLNPGGLFFLLLPFKRDEEIRSLVYQNKMQLKQITLVRQSVHHNFFRIMIMGTITEEGYSEAEFDEISIWDEHQQYTEEFVQLLKDYYLYL
ncbi:MAG: methyltransferase [Bacteroidetes bacterium]|nr:MAG: methyltransferase [Bacteroidota bacterium]